MYERLSNALKIIDEFTSRQKEEEEKEEKKDLFETAVKKEDYRVVKLLLSCSQQKNDFRENEKLKILCEIGSASLIKEMFKEIRYQGEIIDFILKFDRVDIFQVFNEDSSLDINIFSHRYGNIGKYKSRKIINYIKKFETFNTKGYKNDVLYGLLDNQSSDVDRQIDDESLVKEYFFENYKFETKTSECKLITPTIDFGTIFMMKFSSLSLFLFFLDLWSNQYSSVERKDKFKAIFKTISQHQSNHQIVKWFLEKDGKNWTDFKKFNKTTWITFDSFMQYTVVNLTTHNYVGMNKLLLRERYLDYLIVLLQNVQLESDIKRLNTILFDVSNGDEKNEKLKKRQLDQLVRLFLRDESTYCNFYKILKIKNGKNDKALEMVNKVKYFIQSVTEEIGKYIPCSDVVKLIVHF